MIDRQVVYAKYKGRCAYCGKEISIKDMQVDHMIPQRSGGTDDIANLMPSCRLCNHYKRANSIERFREAISTIPVKLDEREYIYKVGIAYGFFDNKQKEVKFWFEQ